MRPQNIGRALGIGVRIAGRIAGRRIMGVAQPGASAPHVDAQTVTAASQRVAQVQSQARAAASITAQTSRGVSKGIGGFLRPFRRVAGIVWLEVTGTFFLLFAALFGLRLWQSWSGIGQISRYLSIGAAVVFLYLGVTSFWRARHR
jgi:hypothetical protein